MEAEVARPKELFRFHYCRVVRGDLACVLIEMELPDLVGAVSRDVRHEGVLVGGVGLHCVGAGGCFQ